jgi:hypothetical protein
MILTQGYWSQKIEIQETPLLLRKIWTIYTVCFLSFIHFISKVDVTCSSDILLKKITCPIQQVCVWFHLPELRFHLSRAIGLPLMSIPGFRNSMWIKFKAKKSSHLLGKGRRAAVNGGRAGVKGNGLGVKVSGAGQAALLKLPRGIPKTILLRQKNMTLACFIYCNRNTINCLHRLNPINVC